VQRNEFQKAIVTDSQALRTAELNDCAADNINVQETGIEPRCVMYELNYFHVVTHCCQDVMHDVMQLQKFCFMIYREQTDVIK
jgi:hypothetical protein